MNGCMSLCLCEGMCVVLVGRGGVYVKDRWSLSGVVPPLLLFFSFQHLCPVTSPRILPHPFLALPPLTPTHPSPSPSSLKYQPHVLSDFLPLLSLSSLFCILVKFFGVFLLMRIFVCVCVCVIAILVPADAARRALKLVESCEGEPAMDTLTDSRGHWPLLAALSEYASAL